MAYTFSHFAGTRYQTGFTVLLKTVYVRFFRSFNFDYLRQDTEGAGRAPWDSTSDQRYYPFVHLDLERDVTTVVGANESGKSQLISAIQCLLGDRPVSPRDFCRYSEYFSVRGKMPLPEFGGRFVDFSAAERSAIALALGQPFEESELWYFRLADGEYCYVQTPERFITTAVNDGPATLHLPTARRLDAEAALPASVSLYDLSRGASSPDLRSRSNWYDVLKNLKQNETAFEGGSGVPPLQPAIARGREAEASAVRSLGLVRDLFDKVAHIDPQSYDELLKSETSDDAYTAALTTNMTSILRDSLNFEKWWSQDSEFALELRKDGFHLVLTLRDKTGQTYTFDERSGGMKHFLSYFIQYLAYERKAVDRDEVILADEPDAYLSAQGQRDLLAVFEAFANPQEDDRPRAQVLYVTHSPFLIDRNHPERIRVLEKGLGEEGTRVVPKAAIDRYEPLRSAFSSFHADTVFIGNNNVLVEGPADLILFSSVSAAMSRAERAWNTLDLNRLTMVPVHGASQYRYMLHLTRSGGLDRPAVVVLLDSDSAGVAARTDLEKGYGDKDIIDPELILAIGDVPQEDMDLAVSDVHEPEDLVSTSVARKAVEVVIGEVSPPAERSAVIQALPEEIKVPKGQRLFDHMKKIVVDASKTSSRVVELTKIDFARAIADVMADQEVEESILAPTFANFDALFTQLNLLTEAAARENNEDRTKQATKRIVERFKRDHRTAVQRRTVLSMFENIRNVLPGVSAEDERIRALLRVLDVEFNLTSAPLDYVDEFQVLRSRLNELVWGGAPVKQAMVQG